MVIAENTAKPYGGRVMNTRYRDLFSKKVDERSADEIVMDTILGAGIEVIE